jgi:hypothetical protein
MAVFYEVCGLRLNWRRCVKLLPFLGVVLLLALGMIYSTQAPRISEGGSDGVAPSWVAAHSKSTKGGNAHRASTSASAIELQQVIEVVASEHSTSSLGAFVPGHTTYRLRALLPPKCVPMTSFWIAGC